MFGSESEPRRRGNSARAEVSGSHAPTPGRTPEQEKRDGKPRVALLVAFLASVPVVCFVVDWRLGLFVMGAYVALGFGVWRVSRQR